MRSREAFLSVAQDSPNKPITILRISFFGIQTTKGTIIRSGKKTITNETITTAADKVYHFHRVVIHSSPLESSATSATTGPTGAVTNPVKSTTTITPLPLPTS